MALHMLLQMRRLLKPRAALLAIMADLLARRTATTTYVVLIQTIHFILEHTAVTLQLTHNSQFPQKSVARVL